MCKYLLLHHLTDCAACNTVVPQHSSIPGTYSYVVVVRDAVLPYQVSYLVGWGDGFRMDDLRRLLVSKRVLTNQCNARIYVALVGRVLTAHRVGK